MPDNKKEQEREELHRAIWAIADDLRGSVDGWDFKSYVLGIMFYRYISENLTNYINADEIAAGNADFDYKGFAAMELDCVWRINPSMVIKGNRNKEKVLMDEFLATQKEYDKKRKARKNGKKQKTVKG